MKIKISSLGFGVLALGDELGDEEGISETPF